MNDNRWHTLLAQKEGNLISLTVDDQSPQKARFAGIDQSTDTDSLFYIGGLPPGIKIYLLSNTYHVLISFYVGSSLPEGVTIFTRFSGCMLLNELQDRNCQHVRLQECNS